jgi:hypothetical protein
MSAENRDVLRQHLPELFDFDVPPWLGDFAGDREWILVAIERPDSGAIGDLESSDSWWDGYPGVASEISNSGVTPNEIGTNGNSLVHLPFVPARRPRGPGVPWYDGGSPPTPDAFAFYLPFHRYAESDWGIYLTPDGTRYFAREFHRRSGGKVDRTSAVKLAEMFMYYHEFFHHVVESFATRLEVDRRVRLYNGPFEELFREQVLKGDITEEALANAYAVRRIGEKLSEKGGWPKRKRDAARAVLVEVVEEMPFGYQRGADLLDDDAFRSERSEFAEANRVRYAGGSYGNPALWLSADQMFRGLETVITQVCYIVPNHGWFHDRFKTHVRFLRATDLKRALRQHGSHLVREGANHEVWQSFEGRMLTVPRHREIADGTARAIFKAAGIAR